MSSIRKKFRFTGTDRRFKFGKAYDFWDISKISGQGLSSIKNRLAGTNFFGDTDIIRLVRNTARPPQQLTWVELFSANWLKISLRSTVFANHELAAREAHFIQSVRNKTAYICIDWENKLHVVTQDQYRVKPHSTRTVIEVFRCIPPPSNAVGAR